MTDCFWLSNEILKLRKNDIIESGEMCNKKQNLKLYPFNKK